MFNVSMIEMNDETGFAAQMGCFIPDGFTLTEEDGPPVIDTWTGHAFADELGRCIIPEYSIIELHELKSRASFGKRTSQRIKSMDFSEILATATAPYRNMEQLRDSIKRDRANNRRQMLLGKPSEAKLYAQIDELHTRRLVYANKRLREMATFDPFGSDGKDGSRSGLYDIESFPLAQDAEGMQTDIKHNREYLEYDPHIVPWTRTLTKSAKLWRWYLMSAEIQQLLDWELKQAKPIAWELVNTFDYNLLKQVALTAAGKHLTLPESVVENEMIDEWYEREAYRLCDLWLKRGFIDNITDTKKAALWDEFRRERIKAERAKQKQAV